MNGWLRANALTLTVIAGAYLVGLTPARGGQLIGEQIARYLDLDGRPFHQCDNTDLAEYLSLRHALLADTPRFPSPAEGISFFARKGMGTEFRLNAVRSDLAEGDCVTFIERTIAAALASDWDSYYRLCERLRHKDGQVAYRNRNFFTLGDWLPNNTAWLLRDVTSELGPADNRPSQTFTHVVRPKIFEEFPAAPGSMFTRTVFKGSNYRSSDKEIRTDTYIPVEQVGRVLSDLKSGDVVLVLRASASGHMGCDHMGLIERSSSGRVSLLHCAPPNAYPIELADYLQLNPHARGFKFLRVRDDARQQVSAELTRSQPTVACPAPEAEDAKVEKLRNRRGKKSD